MSIARNMSVLTATNVPQDTPNIAVSKTTALFADASATCPAIVPTAIAPSVMTLDTLLLTVLSQKTPAAGLSSTTETLKGSDIVLVVQLFKGGIVMVQGQNFIFSVVHWAPLSRDLPGMTKGSYCYKRIEIRNTRGAGIKKKVQDKDYEGCGSRGTEGPGQGRGGDEEKEKNRGES